MTSDLNSGSALADEAQIRALSARWTDSAIRKDFDTFRGLWTEDSFWEIGPPLPSRAEGREAIVTMLKTLLEPLEFFVQMEHSGIVEINGDKASARWVIQEVGRSRDKTFNYNNYAVYEDEMVRQPSGWLYRRRSYRYLWVDTESPISGTSYPLGAQAN